MASEKEYEFVDMGGNNFFQIKLVDGSPYPDVQFQYGAVKLIEEGNQLRVKFEYEVFKNPNKLDTTSKGFRNYLGDILIENLEKVVANKGSD